MPRVRLYRNNAHRQKAYRRRRALKARAVVDYPVPQDLFDKLNKEFHFTLDAAASKAEHRCRRYFTIDDDGLKQPWSGVVWCNPPFVGVWSWCEKAIIEQQRGVTSVLLVPADTWRAEFHDLVLPNVSEVRFVRGRVKFHGMKHALRLPLLLLVFRRKLPSC